MGVNDPAARLFFFLSVRKVFSSISYSLFFAFSVLLRSHLVQRTHDGTSVNSPSSSLLYEPE
jgi:hypothetical protein